DVCSSDLFRVFLNTLQGREFKHPLDYIEKVRLKEADILVGALNSCRIVSTNWTEYGYAGQSGIDIIKQLGSEKIDRPTFKVVAIHHHLLPVNQVEAPKKNGVTLSLDASRILEASQASGVHIALHGHQHMPHLASYQSLPGVGQEQSAGLTVVSNGSVGVAATRRPGEERNTYCVLTFSRDSIRLKMRELRSDQKSGNYLYDLTIDAKPAMPS
uniref:metallophosphoesterase family protein n=1 Tax=Pararhodobacter marinus TaxID=2184063 RepID=UPI003559B4BE